MHIKKPSKIREYWRRLMHSTHKKMSRVPLSFPVFYRGLRVIAGAVKIKYNVDITTIIKNR